MLLISSFFQNLRRISFLADRFKYPATSFRPNFCERPGREYDFPPGVCRKGVWRLRAKASKSRAAWGSGLVRQIKACRRTHARQYAREKASVVEKCVRAVSTRMERERPNARPALLDIPATGGGWAILLASRTMRCMRAGSVRAVRTRMERERPNVRPQVRRREYIYRC